MNRYDRYNRYNRKSQSLFLRVGWSARGIGEGGILGFFLIEVPFPGAVERVIRHGARNGSRRQRLANRECGKGMESSAGTRTACGILRSGGLAARHRSRRRRAGQGAGGAGAETPGRNADSEARPGSAIKATARGRPTPASASSPAGRRAPTAPATGGVRAWTIASGTHRHARPVRQHTRAH